MANCNLCPRNCNAPRGEKAGTGFCGMGTLPVLARAALHFWEEPFISGTRGSGTVFFSGCALGCVFCQNDVISRQRFGRALTAQQLAGIFKNLEEQGAHNINLVNPTHFVPAIVQALKYYRPHIPIVYNSGGYEKRSTLRALRGLVDIYLPDFKYISPETAARYAGAPDYFAVAAEAIEEMALQTGPLQLDEDGLLQRGLVVRHLVLPGHVKESRAILRYLKEALPPGCAVSLMGQYVPCGRARQFPEIDRPLTAREYDRAVQTFMELDFDHGFVQERGAASKAFIPDFALQGLPEQG